MQYGLSARAVNRGAAGTLASNEKALGAKTMRDHRNRSGVTVLVVSWALAAALHVPAAGAQGSSQMAGVQPQSASANPSRTRSAAAATKRYFVDFRSRNALSYGHTFLLYGKLDAQGRVIKSTVAGLHPFTESSIPWTIGHLIPVPSETGASDGDTEDEYITASYRILLNEAEYNKLVAYIKQHQEDSRLWHALLKNCNSWVGDVAQFLGLKTPYSSVLLYPAEYITSLREINGGRRYLDPSFAGGSDPAAYASSATESNASAVKPATTRTSGARGSAARHTAAQGSVSGGSASSASDVTSRPGYTSPPQSVY